VRLVWVRVWIYIYAYEYAHLCHMKMFRYIDVSCHRPVWVRVWIHLHIQISTNIHIFILHNCTYSYVHMYSHIYDIWKYVYVLMFPAIECAVTPSLYIYRCIFIWHKWVNTYAHPNMCIFVIQKYVDELTFPAIECAVTPSLVCTKQERKA